MNFSTPGARIKERCYDAAMSHTAPAPSTENETAPSSVAAGAPATLLNRRCIDEIRAIERAAGRDDVLSAFVSTLERNLADFTSAFDECIASGDATGATRAAHTLKGACRQLGAEALGDVFEEIERSARAGDYVAAGRSFEAAAGLIVQSLQALKSA